MLLKKLLFIKTYVSFTLFCWMTSVFASNGDTDFADLYDKLSTWSQGTLGRSIALMFLLVGLGVGVIRGSIMGAVVCVAAAMALFIGPQIIDNIFTALI